ncbi:MAG: XRE family transcriptional regulator [Flavobacterium johnsoniae]|nr:MAG: XRE family transcriptional regulator [Flavobacterium johnsoniae]
MEKNKNKSTEFPEFRLIAERLKELRKLKGYASYEHIAFALGMSRSAYWKLESGANFELKTLIRVCRVLEVSLEEFFKGIGHPAPKK